MPTCSWLHLSHVTMPSWLSFPGSKVTRVCNIYSVSASVLVWLVLCGAPAAPTQPMHTIPLAWMGQSMGFCGSWNGCWKFNFQLLRLLHPKTQDLGTSIFSKSEFSWEVTLLQSFNCTEHQAACLCSSQRFLLLVQVSLPLLAIWDIAFPLDCSNISRGHYCLWLPSLGVLPVIPYSILRKTVREQIVWWLEN